MTYRFIIITLFFIQTFPLLAQGDFKGFKFEIEYPDGHLELDSVPNWQPGKKYTRCLIQDRYEIQPNADTMGFAQRRQWSWEYISPKFDSIVEKIEIRPAYSFYEVNRKVKLPRHAQIIPAIWDYKVVKDAFLKEKDWYFMRVLNDDNVSKNENCMVMKFFETLPIPYKTFQYFLKTPAILIQTIDNQKIRDTLKKDSPYLKWTHVPARYVTRTRFILKFKPRFVIKTSVDSMFKPHSSQIRAHTGGVTEWGERSSSCCYSNVSPGMIALQKGLRKRWYRVKVTGIFDAQTKKALIRFQKKHHLPTGNLDIETVVQLGLEQYMFHRPILDYHPETRVTHFKYHFTDDFNDAVQIPFLTDMELAEWTNIPLKTVQWLRKKRPKP